MKDMNLPVPAINQELTGLKQKFLEVLNQKEQIHSQKMKLKNIQAARIEKTIADSEAISVQKKLEEEAIHQHI